MEMRSQFAGPFLPYLREDFSAQAQVSCAPGGGWFVPIGRRLLPAPPEGIVRWTHVSPLGVNPGAAGLLRAVESLRTAMEAAS